MQYVGMMSGTSMDGIDVAAIGTDGHLIAETGPASFLAYSDADRALLRRALADAAAMDDRFHRPGSLKSAENMITGRHIDAFQRFLTAKGLARDRIAAVGFHGQTVVHRPDIGLTVQIGDPQALADAIGLTVVGHLRQADMAAGGQGAPLVPVYHRALAKAASLETPAAIVNIGGVANVTYVSGEGLIAFDTGPGNALIDDWVGANGAGRCDENGRISKEGRVDEAILETLCENPFFSAPPPKSLDRNAFSHRPAEGLSLEDGAATLVAFTARSIAQGLALLPGPPKTVVIAGGGRHNPVLMAALANAVGSATVLGADDLGWRGDFIEAEAFAYLAARRLIGEPITFPGTTGVARPTTGGEVFRPSA